MLHTISQPVLLRLESVLTISTLAPSAFALLRLSISPSYSAMLLVVLNLSLATYFDCVPKDDTSTVYEQGLGLAALV